VEEDVILKGKTALDTIKDFKRKEREYRSKS